MLRPVVYEGLKLSSHKILYMKHLQKREREILQQLERQEDDTAEIHQTYSSLQQEVEAKTRKLRKLHLKLQKVGSIEVVYTKDLRTRGRMKYPCII